MSIRKLQQYQRPKFPVWRVLNSSILALLHCRTHSTLLEQLCDAESILAGCASPLLPILVPPVLISREFNSLRYASMSVKDGSQLCYRLSGPNGCEFGRAQDGCSSEGSARLSRR